MGLQECVGAPTNKAGACPSLAQQGAQETTAVIVSCHYLSLKKTEISHKELLCRVSNAATYTSALAWRGAAGLEWCPRSPALGSPRGMGCAPSPGGQAGQGRPHADPCPSLSFQFWGARCVLGTSGVCTSAGCRALPFPAFPGGRGLASFQPLFGPSPHLPRGFAGPAHPRKAGRVTSAIATGTRHPTFTNEEEAA